MSESIMGIRVAGSFFGERYNNIKKLNAKSELILVREPENTHDPNAIKVMVDLYQTGDLNEIGYIPAMTALWLAPVIDAGGKYEPRIRKIKVDKQDDKNISLILDLVPVG